MCLYDMNHQLPSFCDNVSSQPTQNSNSNFDYLVSLLVKHKLQKLSSRTSDPERAMKFLVDYIGLQSYHPQPLLTFSVMFAYCSHLYTLMDVQPCLSQGIMY